MPRCYTHIVRSESEIVVYAKLIRFVLQNVTSYGTCRKYMTWTYTCSYVGNRAIDERYK